MIERFIRRWRIRRRRRAVARLLRRFPLIFSETPPCLIEWMIFRTSEAFPRNAEARGLAHRLAAGQLPDKPNVLRMPDRETGVGA